MKPLRLSLLVLAGLLVLGLVIFFLRPRPVSTAQVLLEIVAQAPAAPILDVSSPSQQLYKIDPAQSEASYSVQETILQTTNGRTAVGTTNGITGEFVLDSANISESQLGQITINVEQLTSDSRLRDDRIRASFLESSTYPEAVFIPEQLIGLPARLEPNQTYSFQIKGFLTVKEITAKTTWDATLSLQDDKLIGSASTTIYMSTFGVGPISIAGLLETKDEMKLSLEFVAIPETTPLAQPNPEAFQVVSKTENVPEFFADIKPILEANCVACHSVGQIGHSIYALETAEDAVSKAEDLALVTSTKFMPPWPPSDKTPPLKHSRAMTTQEIERITAWADARAPANGPLETPLKATPKEGVKVRHDVLIEMPEPYTSAMEGNDDYRCFLVDPKLEQDTFITGYEFLPGNLNINHHMILFLIPPEGRTKADELEARDPVEGWTCFGESGIDEAYPTAISWTPGEMPIRYTEGTGIRLPKGTLFVLQMHYNLSAGVESDQSGVALETTTNELEPILGVDMFAPVELPCPANDTSEVCTREHAIADLKAKEPNSNPADMNDGMLAVCGKTLADYRRQDPNNIVSSCDYRSLIDGDIVSVYGHMHTLGRSLRIILNPDTPQQQILLDIPHWSFNWQSTYTLQTPIALKKGDSLRVVCSWNNSPKVAGLSPQTLDRLTAFAPILGLAHAHDNISEGKSRYVIWGEGTNEEMCIGSFYVLPMAQYRDTQSVVYFPNDAEITRQVLWLRLQRQFIWLIPLTVVLFGGAALLVWQFRKRLRARR
jgi:polyisoprenoid-binding protein YceI